MLGSTGLQQQLCKNCVRNYRIIGGFYGVGEWKPLAAKVVFWKFIILLSEKLRK
jgi:hypothetical protein